MINYGAMRPTALLFVSTIGILGSFAWCQKVTADAGCLETNLPVATLLSLAEQGDAKIAFLLGCRYSLGSGGVKDDSEAVRWFRQAAESDLAEAQYHLGFMYANGRGVVRDAEQAASWLRQAAEQGLPEAQFTLGTYYLYGRGVEKNPALAADWLAKAADQGDPHAQYNLGYLYESGYGVPMNADLAKRWYRASADSGYGNAEARLKALLAKLEAPHQPKGDARHPTQPPAERRDVRSLDPNRYAIQLASHKTAEQAETFIDRHGLGLQATYFVSKTGKSTWFKVIHGVYDSYEAAKAAIASLPAVIRKGRPWVRNIGKIQKEIR